MVVARTTQGERVEPFEVLFLHRPRHMRVFGGFHVFPGGTLLADDSSEELTRRSVLSPGDAAQALGEAAGDDPPLAFFICAVRELFEEAGMLLATRGGLPVDVRSPAISKARRRLIDSDDPFSEIVADLDLVLSTERLRYQTRWVAPEVLPVRFDLRVFVAEPSGPVYPDPHEADGAEWLPPGAALGMAETGAIQLAPPTIGTLTALMRFSDVRAMMTGATERIEAPVVFQHSPTVRRIVAPNTSMMTGPGTNTYIVGRGPHVVIDPGAMDESHLEAIRANADVGLVVITHGHPDHFPGAFDLAGVTGAEVAASPLLWERSFVDAGRPLADGERLDVGGSQLEVVYTPGHSSDHLCLWMPEGRALFSGDLVLGEGTTVISPPDGNLAAYLGSLRRVRALEPATLYPGHFPPRDDASAWIDHYISHRADRERQILSALGSGASTIPEVVALVYEGYPRELHPVAERSVLAHLLKLVDEGRVAVEGDSYRDTRAGDA